MNADKKIELPDLESEEMREIHTALREFGLNDGEFTFAPAIGGVLVYDSNSGLIWFPMIVMEALGTSAIESQFTESIGNYAGNLSGMYVGGATGGAITGAVASGTLLSLSKTLRMFVKNARRGVSGASKVSLKTLGFSGGFLAVSILGGAYVGQLIGKKAVQKWGFVDPPKEMTPYPENIIHHIEIFSPSMIAKYLDVLKTTKDKIFSRFKKQDTEHRNSIVLYIVTRFKPQTGELSALVNRTSSKVEEQQKSRGTLLKPISWLKGISRKLFASTRVASFNLTTYVDAIRFKDSEVLKPLINTIKAQGIALIENKKAD